MTKTELIASLKAEYLEEVNGIKGYVKMIKDIEPCDPTGDYRKILKAILKDEFEHQKYLLKVLMDMNAFMPPDVMQAMEDIESLRKEI